jgi:hypothetical protein
MKWVGPIIVAAGVAALLFASSFVKGTETIYETVTVCAKEGGKVTVSGGRKFVTSNNGTYSTLASLKSFDIRYIVGRMGNFGSDPVIIEAVSSDKHATTCP